MNNEIRQNKEGGKVLMQVGPNVEKQERTKKRIKDIFMKLYSKYPLEKISMRQIADLAGETVRKLG